MVQAAFDQWVRIAYDLGVFRYLLPFLLVFLVVYGVLERVSPFGGGKERVHGLLAAVIGLFVIVFTPAGTSVSIFFSNFFGAVAVALAGILAALIVAGFVFGEDFMGSGWAKGLGGLGVLIVVTVFLWWGGLGILFPGERTFWTSYLPIENIFGIALAVGLVMFLYWALGEEGGGGDG